MSGPQQQTPPTTTTSTGSDTSSSGTGSTTGSGGDMGWMRSLLFGGTGTCPAPGSGPGTVDATVSGLSELTGHTAASDGMTMSRDPDTVARNSPDPNGVLPFDCNGGWDAEAILHHLGQHDTQAATDSDDSRCVQAVSIAAHVVNGPGSVVALLNERRGTLPAAPTARQTAAAGVMQQVATRISAMVATYGDLSWAQESLHDLTLNDDVGTPATDIAGAVAGGGLEVQPMNVWCDNPQQVTSQAGSLRNGEQLITTTWEVIFNSTFDDLEDQGIHTSRHMRVNVNGHDVWMDRIDTTHKPPHDSISAVRDGQHGHQLLIFRNPAGALRLYEPEVTVTGDHLTPIADNSTGEELAGYFNDTPDYGIYHYVQILGKAMNPNPEAPIGDFPDPPGPGEPRYA